MENEQQQQSPSPQPQAQEPYTAPVVEVTEVQAERGYAASGSNSPWGGSNW